MKYTIIAAVALLMTIASPVLAQENTIPSDKPDSASQLSDAPAHVISGLHERNPRYMVRKGDTFDLDFALSPEFNQTVAVQPDGYATLKGVGTIFVENQTVPELTQTVKAAYSRILHDPVIAIILKDFEKPYFIASGQVARPGKYDLRSDLTVTEGIAIAGGFNDKAKHSQVVLFHAVPGGYEAKILDIKKLLATRNLSEDPHLQPGDMLYVPQSTFSRIRPFLPTTSMGTYYSPMMY